MTRTLRPVLFVVFAVTGFSALTLQVVWQRVLSLHAGIDLLAATTVVTAFMAGLGIGSLAGGVLADRLRPRGALLAFAAANVAIGLFAASSLWIFYDFYRQLAPGLQSAPAMFAFHFALLAVPTTLMGLSLPLLARGAVRAAREIAPLVGRLYAVNTLGAALGAAVTGWMLLGEVGFVATVRIAGALNLAAAAAVLFLAWAAVGRADGAAPGEAPQAAVSSDEAGRRTWPWFLLYALTGAVAIGLEVLYFRIVDAIWRNNSYSFATVLAIYLLLLAAGAALAARRAGRTEQPDRWFLWLQFGVGASSLAGLLVLLHPPEALGIRAFVVDYFHSGGFMHGGYSLATPKDAARFLYALVLAPALVMGLPVLLMGASFPFVQALVARRLESLGRRTGTLLFANVCGNVTGGAVTGFLLLDTLGTAGSLQLLAGALTLAGLAATARLRAPGPRRAGSVAVAATMAALLIAFPSNERFWAHFQSVTVDRYTVEEDRACVTALVDEGPETFLYINGNWQNGHPYDIFHILIGLLPSVMHERPARGLAVGLGIGSTAYSMAQDPRVERVDCVEICGGEKRLIADLARRKGGASQRLLADERIRLLDGDGRRWLLSETEPYNMIVVDAVRPNSAYAGNLYSVEFFELVASRLTEDGLFVSWIPTTRTLNSVRRVFPHVAMGEVPDYFASRYVVASRSPLPLDSARWRERFAGVDLQAAFTPQQEQRLRDFFAADGQLRPLGGPEELAHLPPGAFNNDLYPRDEYFLNTPR